MVVPPTPEAASLGKFSEMPISHYTGLPNISVPIASFNVGDKTFPVSLSYHARGIQVSELASRVGIGWALNAGGQISRQVRDKADDINYGNGGLINRLEEGVLTNNTNFCYDISSYLQNVPNPEPDRLPDVYNIQVSGISAKFIFDYNTSEPILQKFGDITIEHKQDGNFLVTDKDGYKYTFGGTDATNKKYPGQSLTFKSSGQYTLSDGDIYTTINTWLLTSIESPNGDKALFYYKRESSHLYNRSYDEYSQSTYLNHTSYGENEQFQLSEIRYNISSEGYDKIAFEANDVRADVHAAGGPAYKELDAIKLYSKINGYNPNANYQAYKTFNLFHSYMDGQSVSPGNYHPTLFNMDPTASKRLVLDSITEMGQQGNTKPPFVFTYNDQKLPNRFSNSQDFWGYYNGANNGIFLDFGNNNRRVDTLLSQAGMLEKITYPTGGSTKFTYEHNKGMKGSEYDNTWFPDINPSWHRSEVLSSISGDLYNTTGGIYGGGMYKTDVFTVTSRSQFNFNVSLPSWNGTSQNSACVSTPYASCKFRIRLVPIVNGSPDYTSLIYIQIQCQCGLIQVNIN